MLWLGLHFPNITSLCIGLTFGTTDIFYIKQIHFPSTVVLHILLLSQLFNQRGQLYNYVEFIYLQCTRTLLSLMIYSWPSFHFLKVWKETAITLYCWMWLKQLLKKIWFSWQTKSKNKTIHQETSEVHLLLKPTGSRWTASCKRGVSNSTKLTCPSIEFSFSLLILHVLLINLRNTDC